MWNVNLQNREELRGGQDHHLQSPPPLTPGSPPHNLSPVVSSPAPDPCDSRGIHSALKGPYKVTELGAL